MSCDGCSLTAISKELRVLSPGGGWWGENQGQGQRRKRLRIKWRMGERSRLCCSGCEGIESIEINIEIANLIN